ncbi:MAG: hypothetical protein AB8B99_10555 [Phormidesmis sp.]
MGLALIKQEKKEAARTAFTAARQLYEAMGLSKDVEDCNKQLQSLDESASTTE